jgi:3-dehydroquinate synthase
MSMHPSVFEQTFFGSLAESPLSQIIRRKFPHSKIVIMVDDNTHDHCLEYLLTTFEELTEAEVMLLPAGEENKVLEVCYQVWEALSEYQVGRKDLVINLGGGVVTDMGGFIASVFKRGLEFIQIPTTLLGMVDAAIGGKTGVDLGPFKNQIGVFQQPLQVIIDPAFLGTLNDQELMNGYAEMLKHALVADKTLWNELDITSIDQLQELDLIKRSTTIKMTIVHKDPLEQNLRKLLNFGHTLGHAIEGYLLEKDEAVGHGHAVALGMISESYLSYKKGLLSQSEMNQIVARLLANYPIPEMSDEEIIQLVQLCKNDKKNEENKINCTLLSEIGKGEIDQFVSESEVTEALQFLFSLNQ